MHNQYRKALMDNGIAESRTYRIHDAMASMHSALALMDTHNVQTFNKLYPGVSKAVNDYVSFNDGLSVIRED
jgi:hypothetical protein